MKISHIAIAAFALLATGTAGAQALGLPQPSSLIVTASNTPVNQLLVYSPTGALVKTIATGGKGGVAGNAGGIVQNRDRLAVVNFGSNTVSIFAKDFRTGSLKLETIIPVAAGPVSVALNEDHLYVLTDKSVESHPIEFRGGVSPRADGATNLLIGDGSAAQVGIVAGQLVLTEKSNAIETVNLDRRGAIGGEAVLAMHIPANVNAPFGLATRGANAYVTIAHANEISLVQHNTVVTVTGSGTQMAPCWVALDGPFLFSANSPSHSVSRYVVAGEQIIQAVPVAATFNGNPTDITYAHENIGNGLAAVVDSNGTASHLSIFKVDGNGNLGLQGLATITTTSTNGVAIVKFSQGGL